MKKRMKAPPPPRVTAELVATGMRLQELLTIARGDPRLTAWEEGFLASMADMLRRTEGCPILSDKQIAVLLKIEDKTRTLPSESLDEAMADDWEG